MPTNVENKLLSGCLSGDKWEKIGADKRSGIVVPLFSVYSSRSTGIGDLSDLRLLIDLCRKTGNSVLQLLPMNEVGPDFCPYDSVSSFALEPMYLSLRDINGDRSSNRLDQMAKDFQPKGRSNIDYGVKAAKLALLREMYDRSEGAGPEEYKRFEKENEYWLSDFALFKVIKQDNSGKAWYDWPEKLRQRDPATLGNFTAQRGRDLLFQKWLQWQLCLQFKAAKKYAASKGVFIKGDLPILVSRDSADVWAHREFFKLEYDSGAPPDMYCAKGQRWGTCTYNWEKIFADGGVYIKEKLAYAANFYDLIRLDHVVGLFRIWSIPVEEPVENYGLNGFFDPKDKAVWEANGRKILDFVIKNTNMLLCAEDLGTIPPECPKVLKEFGIPGNDVQRWTKEWEKIHDFLPPEQYRFLSVTMLSTHDTTNWPAWWENEAGTVDEALFIRLCGEGKVDYDRVKDKLFDPGLSRHGRLRWNNSVYSLELFLGIMGKKKEELWILSGMYENSFREKEKLWKLLAMPGQMREKSDTRLVSAMVANALASRSVFCFNLILDLLFLGGILKGDAYQYRINVPGTVEPTNWSLLLPLSLEDLLAHPVCEKLRQMNERNGRA